MTPKRGRERPERNQGTTTLPASFRDLPFPHTSLDTAWYRPERLNTNSNKPCYREGALKSNSSSGLAGHVLNCNILNKYNLKSTNVYHPGRSRSESQWH